MSRRVLITAAMLALPAITLETAVTLASAAMAGDPRRDSNLADYAAQSGKADPRFSGFSAQRGETLFRTRWAGRDERTASCTACHTGNPKQAGQNAKTGRPI